MTRAGLLELIERIAEPLIPIVGKAISGLLEGKPIEEVLTQAERDALAASADRAIDEIFGIDPKKPVPGTGV